MIISCQKWLAVNQHVIMFQWISYKTALRHINYYFLLLHQRLTCSRAFCSLIQSSWLPITPNSKSSAYNRQFRLLITPLQGCKKIMKQGLTPRAHQMSQWIPMIWCSCNQHAVPYPWDKIENLSKAFGNSV